MESKQLTHTTPPAPPAAQAPRTTATQATQATQAPQAPQAPTGTTTVPATTAPTDTLKFREWMNAIGEKTASETVTEIRKFLCLLYNGVAPDNEDEALQFFGPGFPYAKMSSAEFRTLMGGFGYPSTETSQVEYLWDYLKNVELILAVAHGERACPTSCYVRQESRKIASYLKRNGEDPNLIEQLEELAMGEEGYESTLANVLEQEAKDGKDPQ